VHTALGENARLPSPIPLPTYSSLRAHLRMMFPPQYFCLPHSAVLHAHQAVVRTHCVLVRVKMAATADASYSETPPRPQPSDTPSLAVNARTVAPLLERVLRPEEVAARKSNVAPRSTAHDGLAKRPSWTSSTAVPVPPRCWAEVLHVQMHDPRHAVSLSHRHGSHGACRREVGGCILKCIEI
jgi:hypothetical protein